MSLRVFIPRDAGALAVGADEVAAALRSEAARRGIAIDIVRTGSRGLYWLEPMIEVATEAGRVAYGPVAAGDVKGLVDSGLLTGGKHPLPPCRIGSTRGVEVIERIVRNEDRPGNIAVLEDLCHTMKFGSLCALGGFTPYPVMSALTHFPEDFGTTPRRLQAAE
jgi:hypothetical protein